MEPSLQERESLPWEWEWDVPFPIRFRMREVPLFITRGNSFKNKELLSRGTEAFSAAVQVQTGPYRDTQNSVERLLHMRIT